MKSALEDRFMGATLIPSFSEKIRWEESNRRVRAVFAGVPVADSKRVMLSLESGHLPVFYFPQEDVRMDLLTVSDHHTSSPLKGEATYWNLRVGEREAQNVAWSYANPSADAPKLQGYVAFYWDQMDAWYEEDEQVFGHARDPYHRVDILQSSRHVKVMLGGEVVADSRRPRLLFETGLLTRYYLPVEDVRMDLLAPTESNSYCPYKGKASYWSASVGEQVFDDVVWSYRDPLPACTPIDGYLCFYNEHVDAIFLDDEQVPVPETPWSRKKA